MIKSPISKKEGFAMYEDTVVSFSHPDRISIEDSLTTVLLAALPVKNTRKIESRFESSHKGLYQQ